MPHKLHPHLPDRLRFALFPLGFALFLGCQQTPDSSTDMGSPPTPDQAQDLPPGSIRLTIGPLTTPLMPGKETTMCITGHLPTTMPMDVVQIATVQHQTHHVIFYHEKKSVTDSELSPCPPLDVIANGGTRKPLFIGESETAEMKLPSGVAYHFEDGDGYTIEGHFLNSTTNPISPSADVILTPAPSGMAVQLADMLFYMAVSQLNKKYDGVNPGLPPNKETTIDPAFIPIPSDINVFAMTSHQHHLGKQFVVSRSTSLNDPGTELFTNINWDHPDLHMYNPPLTFMSGEGVRWVCSYNNTTNKWVTFGQSALDNEMCIVWGYYYPSDAHGFILQAR